MMIFPSLDRWRNQREAGDDPGEAARARTYPPPYPAGWYHLLDGDQVRPGRSRVVECFGGACSVSRSGGQAAVHDRLGHAWPARELHGMILAYHEPGRSARSEPVTPRFGVEPIADIEDGRLTLRGTYDGGFVKMHLVEFVDNSADSGHFAPLHGEMLVPFLGGRIPTVAVHHTAGLRMDPEFPHVVHFEDDAHLSVLGRHLPWTGARARITLWGPGSLNWFRITLPRLGDIVFFQTHLPVGPLVQRVRFRVFADRRIGRVLVLYVIGSWIAQWRRDVAVWERKIHRARPLLAPGDGPLPEVRRWFRQFYEL